MKNNLEITKPVLILDEGKCKSNIQWMAEKARASNTKFRPHFKTHQSLQIGRWFKDQGVDKIAVSSLEMATYFAEEWDDITVAFPVNILEMDTINELARKITLHLLIETEATAAFLRQNLQNSVGCFLKIDVGTGRTGINPTMTSQVEKILSVIENAGHLHGSGFLAHAGHTYQAKSTNEIGEICKLSKEILTGLKSVFSEQYPGLLNSLGDTPGCSIVDDFNGIDEIRPGNFVFYDLMQYQLGACQVSRIAVAMACPVVAIHEERNEMVIYGGAVHFSKEFITTESEGIIYGRVVERKDGGWGNVIPGLVLSGLSQEHGIITGPAGEIGKYKAGDVIIVLPVHSCLTASLSRNYITTGGKILSKFSQQNGWK
ncbi:MAG: alanine racemase [Bacteroidales bacterium]